MFGWRTALMVLVVAGLSTTAAHAQQRTIDMHLEAAGFVMRPADTARKMERLKELPARKFVARTNAGARYYIYADPDLCRCAFVGTQQAYNAYRDMVSPPSLPPGYRSPADAPASGASPMHEVVEGMMDDYTADPDDIFHMRF